MSAAGKEVVTPTVIRRPWVAGPPVPLVPPGPPPAPGRCLPRGRWPDGICDLNRKGDRSLGSADDTLRAYNEYYLALYRINPTTGISEMLTEDRNSWQFASTPGQLVEIFGFRDSQSLSLAVEGGFTSSIEGFLYTDANAGTAAVPIPEPGTLALLGLGLAGLAASRKRGH